MMNQTAKIMPLLASLVLVSACESDTSGLQEPSTGVSSNPGIVSQKNFAVSPDNPTPAVITITTDNTTTPPSTTTEFTGGIEVVVTATVGDRNNQLLTDAHTIFFKTEFGVIEPSCVTEEGKCSVTWTSNKSPDDDWIENDGLVTIMAYTNGEETFSDVNGNNLYDDIDEATLRQESYEDLDEPYVDANENAIHDTGEEIVDTVNGNDPTGKNGVHDFPDTFYNGPACTHSSLCSAVVKNPVIWDSFYLDIVTRTTASATR